jgi:hypothetical protein
MAYVIADPEMMTAAAADLAAIGENVNAAHMVAAAKTTAVIPAAADEVSASIAHVFSQHAASYQALAGQAAAFQEQFVQHLTAGAFSYADIEAALASLLQPLTASIGSAVSALRGQLLNLWDAAVLQLLISLFSLFNQYPILYAFAFFGLVSLFFFAALIISLPVILANTLASFGI